MKRTRFFLLLIAAWLLTTVVHAEQSDTTIFHQCAMTHILPSVSIQSLRSVFSYWKEWNEGENSRVYMEYDWRPYTAQEPGLTLPKNFWRIGHFAWFFEQNMPLWVKLRGRFLAVLFGILQTTLYLSIAV